MVSMSVTPQESELKGYIAPCFHKKLLKSQPFQEEHEMYTNPRHLRDHEIKARFDEDTYQLIEAMANFHHTQKAVLVRELVEAALARMVEQDDSESIDAA